MSVEIDGVNNIIKADTISEVTSANGVAIDGLTIKDGGISATTGAIVFNEASADLDFRVESNANTHMLFIDGGNNKIGVNNASPARQVHITDTIANGGGSLGLTSSDSSTSGSFGTLHFGNNTDSSLASIGAFANGATDAGALIFKTEATGGAIEERVRFSAAEAVFNEGSFDIDFRVESNGNANMLFVDGGNNRVGINATSMGANFQVGYHDTLTTATSMGSAHANDGTLLVGGANSGTTQGSIYVGGQNGSANSVMGAIYGFSGGSQSSGIEFLEGSGDAYGQIKMSVAQGTGGTLVESMRINEIGAVTMPLQPAFHAGLAATTQTNLPTGVTTLEYKTERFDQNADFNVSNYTFTAPVTGKYFLAANVEITSIDNANDYMRMVMNTSNLDYYQGIWSPNLVFSSDGGYWSMHMAQLVDMDANDTALIQIQINSGAAQVDIVGTNANVFSGYLVC